MIKSFESNHFPSNKSTKSIISKSSRLLKKNPQESIEKSDPLYFKEDPMRSQIFSRVSRGKQKENKNYLDKAQNIIDDLMSRHEKAKLRLQKMKEQAEKQYEKVCTFTPRQTCNQRYVVTGDVVRRNQVWMRQKKRKQLELREQVTNNSLRQCTFSPKFSSKKQSQSYLKFRDLSRSMTPTSARNLLKSPKNSSPLKLNTSQNTNKRDFTQVQYELAKKNLISRMMGSLN